MVNVPHVAPAEAFKPLPVRKADRVFVLTGAGISAESGVKTFRDAGGLWEDHHVEDVATPEGWSRDPALVWRFYSERRRQLRGVTANPAHLALARLETHAELFLCTQNVDDLHERAGSREVCHMHGELLSTRCARSDHSVTLGAPVVSVGVPRQSAGCDRPPFRDEELYLEQPLPRCVCGGALRPDIVWFGEIPMHMDRIGEAVSSCELFVTVGSSGAVYPAAGLVSHVREHPSRRTGRFAKTVYVGLERPENAHAFDECRLGKAGEVLPTLFALVD